MREIAREIQKAKDHTFIFRRYSNAVQLIPSSATVTIYDNGGSTMQTGAATIASDGTMSYTFLTANNTKDERNFKIVLSYVVSGTTYEDACLFDVVLQPLVNTSTDIDLYTYIPELRRKLYSFEGETDNTGNVNQISADELKSDDRDWTGGKIELFVSDTKVHDADISAYSKANGTLTFSPSYSSTIGASIKYTVRESYTKYIDTAYYDYVITDLRSIKGLPAGGYIDSNVIKQLVCFKALEIICFSAIENDGDKWMIRYNNFRQNYSDALTKFKEAYDADEDGYISDGEQKEASSLMMRSIIR